MGKKSAPDARTVSAEERAAIASQNDSLDKLTEIAQSQLDLSDEQIAKYQAAFEDPNNLATDDIAEFQSLLTGKPVTAADLADKSLEDIIRESMLQAPASFTRQAEDYVAKTDRLATEFKADTAFNTGKLVSSLESAGYKYQTQLGDTAKKLGTIDEDILARETGAATAGISSAFAEGQKGLEENLARRGLSGSGLDAQATAQLSQQESLAKFGALSQARTQARGLSDQLRMQQLGLQSQQYQVGQQTAQGIYGAQQQGAGTIYQTGANQAGGVLQARTAGTQQGLGSLGQAYGMGQQAFGQGAGLLAQGAGGFSQAGSGFGGIAGTQAAQSTAQHQAVTQAASSRNAAVGSIIGTGIGIYGALA